jgi:Fe-S-cluster containining protein
MPPPCLSCGTCCFSNLDRYARLDGADHARLGERADELTVFIENRCYMKLHDGHCAALVVDVPGRRFVCGIYESRPTVCRELERGSPACRGEIHDKGQRPLTLLRPRDTRP